MMPNWTKKQPIGVNDPAAYVDIPHFRVRNCDSAGIMEEFQRREGRLADRCSDHKTSLG